MMLSMKTAPKNGMEVILKVAMRAGVPGKYLIGHYMRGGHCIEDHPPIEEGWYFWNGLMFDKAAEPVGWMPIPGEEGKFPEISMAGVRPVISYSHQHKEWQCVRVDNLAIVGRSSNPRDAYRSWLSQRNNDV